MDNDSVYNNAVKGLAMLLCGDYRPCTKHTNLAIESIQIIKQYYKLEEIK